MGVWVGERGRGKEERIREGKKRNKMSVRNGDRKSEGNIEREREDKSGNDRWWEKVKERNAMSVRDRDRKNEWNIEREGYERGNIEERGREGLCSNWIVVWKRRNTENVSVETQPNCYLRTKDRTVKKLSRI